MLKHLLFVAIILFGESLLAQGHHCGTVTTQAMVERLLSNRDNPNIQSRDVEWVPIKFHLVARSDGSGRLPESDAIRQLCVLNNHFADQEIQFYLNDGFNYVNNNSIYNNPQGAGFAMSAQRDVAAVNVFCVGSAGGGADIVTLGYYDTQRDWVVMANSSVSLAQTTFTHELGHFFSLLHPHNGWDCEQYDPSQHGNPVFLSSAPCHSFGVELQDGSNCNISGDFLCDTPPDYLFGLGWNGCEYTNQVRDPNGDIVDPDELNYMSYFLNCDADEGRFSNEQKAIIASDLAGSSRDYLRQNPTPADLDPITEDIQLTSPSDESITNTGTEVTLEWDPVENATQYLIEIDRISSFTLFPRQFITSSTEFTVDGLNIETRYFWRVTPFNSGYYCASRSDARSFNTGLETSTENLELQNLNIFPNPITGNELRIEGNIQDMEISIYEIHGKEVFRSSSISETIRIDPSIGNGIYFLVVNSGDGQRVEKIVLKR